MVTYELSHIDPTITKYYLNSSEFKGTEYMFKDNLQQLYVVVGRRNGTYIDILQSMLLNGHNNAGDVATKYDYRINLSNYIKIIHHDPKYFDFSTVNDTVKYFDVPDNECELFLFISSENILSVNSSLVYNYGNGDMYFNYSDFSSIVSNKLKDNFVFSDLNEGYTIRYSLDSMFSGHIAFQINYNTVAESYPLYNISFKDSNGNSIVGYGYSGTIYNSTTGHRIVLAKIPDNAKYATFLINGVLNYSNIFTYCVKNQYFYYGTSRKITTLNCTGKRESIKSIERTLINNGLNRNAIKIDKQERYTQNVGFLLSEDKIFDIAITPFLIEFDFDNWGQYEKWYLDNSDFEGYNTKSIANRNFVLNLTRDRKDKRYTSPNVNFFD